MTGVAYSLFAGQPLTILGSTGPVLVFEKILFKFCKYVQDWQQLLCDIIIAKMAFVPVPRGALTLVSSLISSLLLFQGLRPFLSVAADLHRLVDSPAVFTVGCHRCQFPGVLHHSFHRGGLCRPHLPHLHLWGFGETVSPGRTLPLQCIQWFGQAHPGIVSNLISSRVYLNVYAVAFSLLVLFFLIPLFFLNDLLIAPLLSSSYAWVVLTTEGKNTFLWADVQCNSLCVLCIFVCSCKCAEPDNPSNETLEIWNERNITASAVPWANLTVKVT